MDLLGVSTRISMHLAVCGAILKGFKDAQAAKARDSDAGEARDAKAARPPKGRQARAESIAHDT